MTGPVVDVHLIPADAERSLHRNPRQGLTSKALSLARAR